jgi:hypothetical protein
MLAVEESERPDWSVVPSFAEPATLGQPLSRWWWQRSPLGGWSQNPHFSQRMREVGHAAVPVAGTDRPPRGLDTR